MAPTAELIFHGTGTSSCLPNISCIVAPPDVPRCETCWLGADASRGPEVGLTREEAYRNRKRNTGAIYRFTEEGREDSTVIVIDAGKSFVQAAIEWFPKYGLRRIDGLLLTHAHADAMNGLDDLRCWTLRGAIQEHIDIYLTQRTFDEVRRTFPYLVDKGMATGGGDVPDFLWHIISEFEELEIKGVKVVPLLLHHGRYFEPKSNSFFATPVPTRPETPNLPTAPNSGAGTPSSQRVNGSLSFPIPNGDLKAHFAKPTATSVPYPSLGFHLPGVLWFSDVSEIPHETLDYLSRLPSSEKPPVLVIDCLRPKPHMSHFGFTQSIQATRQLGITRSYIIGMTCGGSEYITQRGWEQLCKAVTEGRTSLNKEEWKGSEGERQRCEETLKAAVEAIPGYDAGQWVRPSFDGMRIVVNGDAVSDGVYDEDGTVQRT